MIINQNKSKGCFEVQLYEDRQKPFNKFEMRFQVNSTWPDFRSSKKKHTHVQPKPYNLSNFPRPETSC